MNKEALINQLIAVRASIDAALFLLSEGEGRCNHPEESRINLTVMGGQDRWVCKVCGFEYVEE